MSYNGHFLCTLSFHLSLHRCIPNSNTAYSSLFKCSCILIKCVKGTYNYYTYYKKKNGSDLVPYEWKNKHKSLSIYPCSRSPDFWFLTTATGWELTYINRINGAICKVWLPGLLSVTLLSHVTFYWAVLVLMGFLFIYLFFNDF